MKFKIDYPKYEGKERDGLLELYKDLGWDPDAQLIDPKQLKVSQHTWSKLMDVLFPERTTEQGFFYMNYGPSLDRQMKDDVIKLESKWLITEEAI